MSALRLSVVIPCHNSERDLPELLDSLAEQEADFPWEVVVADNQSTDQTVPIAGSYAACLRLRVVKACDGVGAGYTRNVGAEAARGDAIVFIDSDDEVAPGFVAAMGDALREHDVVAPRIDMETLNDNALLTWRPNGTLQDGRLLDWAGFLPYVTGTGLGLTRQSFDAIGGFDPDVSPSEDVDISWRLQLNGFAIMLEPRAVLRYRYRSEAIALYRQARGYGVGEAALYRKHGGLGMPKRRVRDALHDWCQLVIQIPRTPTRANWYFWVYTLGYRVGRLRGSLRYRVFFP